MPASAAPRAPSSLASISSGPALRKVCSQTMISSTAAAKPVPRASVNSGSRADGSSRAAASSWAGAGSSAVGAPAGGASRRASAGGTTASDTIGAAAIPSATAVWPSAIPIATASANRQRELASMRTSPP